MVATTSRSTATSGVVAGDRLARDPRIRLAMVIEL